MTQAPRRKGGGRASLGFGIPEESPGYGKGKAVHLSQLKALNPRAFKGFVEMLIEDCSAEFTVSDDGTVTARDKGKTLRWNPKSTTMDVGSGWETNVREGKVNETYVDATNYGAWRSAVNVALVRLSDLSLDELAVPEEPLKRRFRRGDDVDTVAKSIMLQNRNDTLPHR